MYNHFFHCVYTSHGIPDLQPPSVVVEKYKKLKARFKITTLAVKLARESFFGNDLLRQCTVMGTREFSALPQDKLLEMKQFVEGIVPTASPPVFEDIWQKCVTQMNQACNGLRTKFPYNIS